MLDAREQRKSDDGLFQVSGVPTVFILCFWLSDRHRTAPSERAQAEHHECR